MASPKIIPWLASLPHEKSNHELPLKHMNMRTKHELAKEILSRYMKSTKQEKKLILDEFCANTGYGRKYAITKLKKLQLTPTLKDRVVGKHTRNRERIYDSYVSAVVEQIYEALGGIGAKRMHPLISTMIEKGIAFGHIKTDLITEAKVCAMSKGTLDRMMKKIREKNAIKGISTTRPGPLLKSEIALRVGAWEETDPGFSEIDLVAHCGDNGAGPFISTLNTTDILTAWFESEAVMGKAQERILAGIKMIRGRMPFGMLGIDSDNGSEFINRQLYEYCLKEDIVFTRSRPYKKDDNAHIEQKNFTTVRQVLGYQRFDTEEILNLMNELYRGPLRLYINFFQPSVKCIEKKRVGSKIKKVYDVAQTPYERVLAHQKTPEKTKETLTRLFETLDPFTLRKEIDALVHEIQKRGRWHL